LKAVASLERRQSCSYRESVAGGCVIVLLIR
jgi:hypothetical protein